MQFGESVEVPPNEKVSGRYGLGHCRITMISEFHAERHTAAQCNIMVLEFITYDIQSPLIQIGDTMIPPKNADDEL
ncbi:hypothetical protein TNCV_5031661 [Trichonephila clavipes]|nr:hypothetical protein TNCV_5031661 [Trichonephila clavipes]